VRLQTLQKAKVTSKRICASSRSPAFWIRSKPQSESGVTPKSVQNAMCEMQSDCFASHFAPVIDGTSLRFVPYYEPMPSIAFDAQLRKEVPFTTP